jgi:hypothetical protein
MYFWSLHSPQFQRSAGANPKSLSGRHQTLLHSKVFHYSLNSKGNPLGIHGKQVVTDEIYRPQASFQGTSRKLSASGHGFL